MVQLVELKPKPPGCSPGPGALRPDAQDGGDAGDQAETRRKQGEKSRAPQDVLPKTLREFKLQPDG